MKSNSSSRRRAPGGPVGPQDYESIIARPGEKIRIISNFSDHNYPIAGVFRVISVDRADNTLRATDSQGWTGSWISCNDCEKVSAIGWDFIKSVMPPEVATFLYSFHGVEALELHSDIKNGILKRLPNLHELIVEETGRQMELDGKEDPASTEDKSLQ